MTSICIDMMFSHLPFSERIRAAREVGASAIEFWKWTDKDLNAIQKSGMPVSVFNLDSANEKLSYDLSRGILNAGRTEDFLSALAESIPVYRMLNASAMIVLVGEHAPFDAEKVYATLSAAKPVLEKENVSLVVEALNNIDRVGYSMPYVTPLLALVRRLQTPHIKVLYDIYHQSMMGDFSMDEIRENIAHVGHFHVADAPGRHEPGTGRVDYATVLREIRSLSYNGYIGLEYRATCPDAETQGFLRKAHLLD